MDRAQAIALFIIIIMVGSVLGYAVVLALGY